MQTTKKKYYWFTQEELREIRFHMLESERGFGHKDAWHSAMTKIDKALERKK